MNALPLSCFAVGLIVLLLVAPSHAQPGRAGKAPPGGAPATQPTADALVTGADQMDAYVPRLRGRRVAMLVNPTSIIGGEPSVDVLLAAGVRVVKVFGPEHGFRGNASNGTAVADEFDA